MFTFDASSLIYAWENYPIEQFPPLWDWFASEIEAGHFSTPVVAYNETRGKFPDCWQWLKQNEITTLPLSNAALMQSMEIKDLLGIEEDNYHNKGVGENDIFIIATAKTNGLILVSEEERQAPLPQIMSKCKIPAVCHLPEVDVKCIKFIELIKQSDAIFN